MPCVFYRVRYRCIGGSFACFRSFGSLFFLCWLLDIMYISIGFITFYLYLLLSSLSVDFTRIVQHYSCLYCLSYFVFIHVLIIGIRGKNWGICGVTKRAVTMPPLCYKTIFRLSISFCLVFGKTWLYKSIVIERLLCPRMVFKVCRLPPCSMEAAEKHSIFWY